MVKVRVHRISSVSDPETAQPGKQIELVEVRERNASSPMGGMAGTDESKMVKGIISQFQSIGVFPVNSREMMLPKMTLFISEAEITEIMVTKIDGNETIDSIELFQQFDSNKFPSHH